MEESPVKRIEPQSLTPKPNRSKEIIDEANTMEINHFSLEITLEEAIRNREYTVAARRGNTTSVVQEKHQSAYYTKYTSPCNI